MHPTWHLRARTGVKLVLSCEHASRALPDDLEAALGVPQDVLAGHRGWDRGAGRTAEVLGVAFGVSPILGRVSRLAVDLNRSADNQRADSDFARRLSQGQRQELRRLFHGPHWQAVAGAIARGVERGARVLHVSVHSFTPVLRGRTREMDVGLLYDPSRALEAAVARHWKRLLASDGLRVARNAPYRGRDDGITRGMRARFDGRSYAGIELELNQARVQGDSLDPQVLGSIHRSLAAVLHLQDASWAPKHRRPPA